MLKCSFCFKDEVVALFQLTVPEQNECVVRNQRRSQIRRRDKGQTPAGSKMFGKGAWLPQATQPPDRKS